MEILTEKNKLCLDVLVVLENFTEMGEPKESKWLKYFLSKEVIMKTENYVYILDTSTRWLLNN